jgi:hypothetical protein
MIRGLVKLALLAGAGWYAYRKLAGGRNESPATERDPFAGGRSGEADGVGAQLRRSASEAAVVARRAATTMAGRVGAAVPGQRGEKADRPAAEPPEVRAAAMAGMPAVQPPATMPEPEVRAL